MKKNVYEMRQVTGMIAIVVCDDEILECCRMAGRISVILEEMKVPGIIRQFNSGQELLQAGSGW